MRNTSLLTTAILLAIPAADAAVVLAGWTFESSVPATAGPFTAEEGEYAAQSAASGFHASASTTYSNPTGNGSAESFNSNNWAEGDYYEFTAPTTGRSGITLVLDHTSSSTGPAEFVVEYSTDGGSFTTGANYSVTAASWSSGSSHGPSTRNFDFSAIDDLDDQSAVWFRITAAPGSLAVNGDPIASTGTSRVDNVRIVAVPEPTAAWLGACGLLGILRRRR